MADKQLSIRLSEIMTNDPEVVTEIKRQLTEELKLESLNETQKTKLAEAKARIKVLESENAILKGKIAEKAVREYAATEIAKAKLPETVAKNLLETIVHGVHMREVVKQEGEKWVVYSADGEKVGEYDTEEEAKKHEKGQSSEALDPAKFGTVVTEAIKAKQAEIAAILKEAGASGIHDNGLPAGGTPDLTKAREEYRNTLIENGMNKTQADRLAGIEVKA